MEAGVQDCVVLSPYDIEDLRDVPPRHSRQGLCSDSEPTIEALLATSLQRAPGKTTWPPRDR